VTDTAVANTVAVSTMSCRYYLINLKSCSIEGEVAGRGKYAVDLIRAPLGESEKFCGIEANCIVQVDFAEKQSRVLK